MGDNMTYIKKIWKYVIMALYFFFSGYSLPWLLTAAFNYSKGIANNPDGEGLMPFGIIGVLIIIIIDILIIRSHSRNIDNTKKEKIILLSLSFISIIIGILLPIEIWNNFFKCFAFYFTA